MTSDTQTFPEGILGLRAALVAERAARQAAEEEALDARARVSGAETVIAHLKLLIAKLKQERFGASAERGRKLDQLELQLEEIEANAAEDETTAACWAHGRRYRFKLADLAKAPLAIDAVRRIDTCSPSSAT